MALNAFQSTKITYLFDLLDKNKDSLLQKEDFVEIGKQIASLVGFKEIKTATLESKSEAFFNKLSREIGVDSSKTINLKEWIRFFDEEVINTKDSTTREEFVDLILNFLFGYFDENHDGFMSSDEYQTIFYTFEINPLRSRKAFEILDVNLDGKLSRYELKYFIETFLISNDPAENGNWIFGDWTSL